MEQNILKRYNEIHIMLWEEALKQFMYNTDSCISSLKDILCGTVGEELRAIKKNAVWCLLDIRSIKTKALRKLYSDGKISLLERNSLLASNLCSACYVAMDVKYKERERSDTFKVVCLYCPITKWREESGCHEFQVISRKITRLRRYIIKCMNDEEKFNLGAYMKLRNSIIKKMYIVAHLDWGYEENEK